MKFAPGIALGAAALAAALCPQLSRAGAPGDDLRGPPFSDPRSLHTPDDSWVDRPVVHGEGHAGADLVVAMNQQLYPFLLPIVEDFARREGIKVDVLEGTCGKAAGSLNRKEVDVGSFCCPPGELDRLPGLRFHTFGVTPLAILVNPANRVEDLTLEQSREIFQGTITSWSQVGGGDGHITMIASLHCAKRPGHWRLLLENENLFSPQLNEVGDMPDQIRLIASTPAAIGYETLWVAERFREKGAVKGLRIDGRHPAELKHLEEGAYPLYRVFNFTTWEGAEPASPHAARLVDLLIKSAGGLDPRYGIIPADRLRRAGWKFEGDELVGEPGR